MTTTRVIHAWILAVMLWSAGPVDLHAQASTMAQTDADARILALLNAYVVGTATYRAFSLDFDLSGEAITMSRIGERIAPTSGRIGIIEWKDRVQNRNFRGPDAATLAAGVMAAMDSGKVSPEINPYMAGTFVFGHPKDPTEKVLYSLTPEKFTVVAQLKFLDGILVEKLIVPAATNQP